MIRQTYKIIIKFNNSDHQEVDRLTLEPQCLSNTNKIRDVIDSAMLPKLKDMKWNGFGLWAWHIAVTKETPFSAIDHQRETDGTVVLDCEDHNCRYRAIHPRAIAELKKQLGQ